MSTYTITNASGIDWSVKGHARILQNVVNLMNTDLYEIAYARTIGVDKSILDMPANTAMAAYANEIMDLIEKREPRARVVSVTPDGVDSVGKILLKVVIEIE